MIVGFIRHGETKYNKDGVVMGATIDIPLNDSGKVQAVELAYSIKDFDYELIICSPLIRAIETASIINNTLGKTKDIIVNAAFIERDFGLLEGGDVQNCYFYLKSEQFDRLHIESDTKLIKRVVEAIFSLKQYGLDKILVVTHSHVIKSIYQYLSKDKYVFDLPIVKNGSIHFFIVNEAIEMMNSNLL